MNKKETKRLVLIAVALAAVVILARVAYPRLSAAYQNRTPAATAETVPAEETKTPAEETETPAEETETPAPEDAPPRIAAPDFTVYDENGEAVSLSDLAGTPVLLNFWASWCPPCRSELPAFDRAWAERGEQVRFLMVDLADGQRETVDTAKAFVAAAGYSFPVVYDTDGSGADAYGVYSIPMTVFIRADGTVLSGQIGAMAEETLTAGLDALLAEDN